LAENVLKQYPDLKKQAAYNKEKILLNHKTADAVTQAVLDPQELDVFDSLNEALENSLMPDTKSLAEAGEGGYHTPAKGEEVPRLASDKQAKWTMKCPWCKGKLRKKTMKMNIAARNVIGHLKKGRKPPRVKNILGLMVSVLIAVKNGQYKGRTKNVQSGKKHLMKPRSLLMSLLFLM